MVEVSVKLSGSSRSVSRGDVSSSSSCGSRENFKLVVSFVPDECNIAFGRTTLNDETTVIRSICSGTSTFRKVHDAVSNIDVGGVNRSGRTINSQVTRERSISSTDISAERSRVTVRSEGTSLSLQSRDVAVVAADSRSVSGDVGLQGRDVTIIRRNVRLKSSDVRL